MASAIVVFAYGSRRALGDRARALQQLARFAKPIFGAALALIGLLVLTGLDCRVEAVGLALMPDWLMNLMARY